MPGFYKAIDTVNARTQWVGDYQKPISNFTYGIAFAMKRGIAELGGNFLWGNGKEMFVEGDDPNDQETQIYAYRIRQRNIQLNFRAGLSLGKHFSLGSEFGGMLNNFQSMKLKSSKTALWFLSFKGEKSGLGLITPYISIHGVIGEGVYLDLQPFYSLTFGKTSFENTIDHSIFSPNGDVVEHTSMKFMGVRLIFGICKQ